MPTKLEARSTRHDLIDDIVDVPISSSFTANSTVAFVPDSAKIVSNRNYSSYSNIPHLFNNAYKSDQNDNATTQTSTLTNQIRERYNLTLPRSNSSSTMISNDERRKELDFVLKHLYDGKLLSAMNDERAISEFSEPLIPVLSKGPITTTTSTSKIEEDDKIPSELIVTDDDCTTLQRELQEKELDIIHLQKEIHELQLENKLLKARVPTVYQNGSISNNSETEVLRRERDILQNELRSQQELVAKIQQQQQQNGQVVRSNRVDEATLHRKEALERKLREYEKQLRALTGENEKLKQHFQQTERTIGQLKKENEELQQKVNEAKKRNEELLYQEFNALRNDLKMLRQRNDELFEENRRLQKEQHRQQQNIAWRSTLQQAYGNEQQSPVPHSENVPPSSSSPSKSLNIDQRRERLKANRPDSPNGSEASDSTNYLTTVSVDRYNNRPGTSVLRSATLDSNNHHRTLRYAPNSPIDEFNRNNYSLSLSKTADPQPNFHSAKPKRSVEWDEENIQQHEGSHNRDTGNYPAPNRSQRQHSTDGYNDYMVQKQPPPTKALSPTSHLYQQNYSLSRSVTLPETQHQSRRSNSYNMSTRHGGNDSEVQNNDRQHSRQRRPSVETTSPRRPYAPTSINDIRMNDIIKFSRPGGKISKGVVKYIGSLPGKTDQYLGLELEDEESKHDGVYQNQRLFQCKPNKGVFVGFSKVIMAWSGK